MSQTALNYLQTVIKRERSKNGQGRNSSNESSNKGTVIGNRPMNSDLANHLHFSTLQLSEVKKEGSFLDDPRSPPNQLFSACTEKNILSRSKSHKKRSSVDWTSSKKEVSGLPIKHVPMITSDCSSSKLGSLRRPQQP